MMTFIKILFCCIRGEYGGGGDLGIFSSSGVSTDRSATKGDILNLPVKDGLMEYMLMVKKIKDNFFVL